MANTLTYVGEQTGPGARPPFRLNFLTLAKAWLLSFLNCFLKCANTLTYLRKDIGAGAPIEKVFTCLLSGNYANGGAIGVPGETLAFNNAAYTGRPARRFLPSTQNGSIANLPKNTDFTVLTPNGYTAQVEQNAANPTANNFALRIFAAGSGNVAPVELASGAYPAALTAAPIIIKVRIPLKND
jgi:hypothetical protein